MAIEKTALMEVLVLLDDDVVVLFRELPHDLVFGSLEIEIANMHGAGILARQRLANAVGKVLVK
jgi:hypothetical protein